MISIITALVVSSFLSTLQLPVSGNYIEFVAAPVPPTVTESAGDEVVANRLPQAQEAQRPVPQRINPASIGMSISAQSSLVVDWESGLVLYSENAEQVRAIASITKLMSALVFLEHNPGWDTAVTITADDQRAGATPIFRVGETVTVRDLFAAALMQSSNEAIVALQRTTDLAPAVFVEEMNALAEQLGMTTASFAEVTGLSGQNTASAHDVAKLVRAALSHPDIARFSGQGRYQATVNGVQRRIDATNWLIGSYLDDEPFDILGGKTGFTEQAGYCLTTAVQRGDQRVISVVLGSGSIDSRFSDTKALLDWAWRNYQW